MAEYIEREAVFKQFDNGEADVVEIYPDGSVDYGFGASNIQDLVNSIPAADVVPVVHAQWIEDGSGIIICPECKRGYNLHAKYTHYCPSCGARMDGGADHAVN